MLTTLITTVSLLGPAALPDAIDHLKSADVVPNVGLVLDASCSMRYNPRIQTTCRWWASRYNRGSLSFNKNQVMRSVLTGCESQTDGILDKWHDRVNFSIYQFGHRSNRASLVAPFDSSLSTLESGVQRIPAASNTPMSLALGSHATYFQRYFRSSNTEVCRPNFMLLLSDGNPNGGSVNYQFNCPKPGDPRTRKYVRWNRPWDGSEYMTEHRDFLCDVPGDQDIKTYTIGFGAPGSFSPSNLQRIAQMGEGEYYYASNVQQLDAAFEQIISAMASRAGLFYSAPAVQLEGLFSDNVVYTSAFQPKSNGAWYGTVKKHCIEPNRLPNGDYDSRDQTCVFKSPDGDTLYTNPGAVDLWTGTATTAATTGGAGAVMSMRLGAPGGTPLQPYYPRNIVTWRRDRYGYVPVKPSYLTTRDTWSTPDAHKRLINKLHGYTYDAQRDGSPVAVSEWPMGDPVHSPTVLLRYGPNCETPRQCFVVVGANDGMLHFFDAATGQETTALVPPEVLAPSSAGNYVLKDLNRQPDIDAVHRYFVDGGIVLFHDDTNGDGRIHRTETAYLIFGLGRGGAGYYLMPISRFAGTLGNSRNPIRPLVHTPGTAFEELQDTWNSPWAGQMMSGGNIENVAIFGSGHIHQFDDPGWPTPSRAPSRTDVEPRPGRLSCGRLMSAHGEPSSRCTFRRGSGYSDPAPQDVTYGPYGVSDGVAYRVYFLDLDLDPNDRLEIRDSQGNVISTLRGRSRRRWSDWVYDTRFEVRLITNGRQTRNKGFKMRTVQYLTKPEPPDREHNPTVFVVDLDRWNGPAPREYARRADDSAVLLRIARRCVGNNVGICVDASVVPELDEMVCPISTEVSVFTVSGIVESMYWGDDCGQIWKAWQTGEDQWDAKRLLSVNNVRRLSQRSPAGRSKDFRKIQRKLDLVSSTCPGKRVVGVYFGTGNSQRPAARDELQDTRLNSGRDLVGVVWDSPDVENLVLGDLQDTTRTPNVDPRMISMQGKRGWYWQLGDDERMLRDPLVFEGTAYFKTYRPMRNAAECSRAEGLDTIYAVDNCSAEAVVDLNGNDEMSVGERKAWTGNTDVGGNFLVVTPKDGAPIVSHANLSSSDRATIRTERGARVPRIFNWREPKEF